MLRTKPRPSVQEQQVPLATGPSLQYQNIHFVKAVVKFLRQTKLNEFSFSPIKLQQAQGIFPVSHTNTGKQGNVRKRKMDPGASAKHKQPKNQPHSHRRLWKPMASLPEGGRCDFGEIKRKHWLLFRLALYCCVLSEPKQPNGITSRKPETRKRIAPIRVNAETEGKEWMSRKIF